MTGRVKGKVYLTGAGPGRADLITVRAARLLQRADCVIYDKLANPALLRYVREDAEIIHVPKRTAKGSVSQSTINELLVEKARQHLVVVRLKGGDPCMFGRGAEEADVLAQAGVDFEIVPGITAAMAGAEYAGLMLTDRRYSSEVAFVTGREAPDKQTSSIDWQHLARWQGSIVFYMAMGNLVKITQRLMDNGMDSTTPAAVIRNATLADQRTLRATVADIAEKCRQNGITPPALVVIGKAAGQDCRLDWFTKLPLFGKSVVITRNSRANAEFADKIAELGGQAVDFPCIEIEPVIAADDIVGIAEKIKATQLVVFTSPNGVKIFFDTLLAAGKDSRALAGVEIAVVGTATAAALAKQGLVADYMPGAFTTEALAEELIEKGHVKGKGLLLLRSAIASNQLPDMLSRAGATVEDVAVYTVRRPDTPAEPIVERLKAGQLDWLTFTSPSTVENFFGIVDADLARKYRPAIASIGPVTSRAIEKLGLAVSVQAHEHTIAGLLEAIESYELNREK